MEKKIEVDIIDHDRKLLIEEALRIRAEACEVLGSDIIASLYRIVTGKKIDSE
tara:strand:- start:41 stop:199 length:159 start_codon:yes stop_codon:yes gene_type:complete